MKISNLIFFSIFFILLLFSITTYVNYTQSEEVRDNAAFLSTSSEIVKQTNRFQRNTLYMERGLRGYVLTGEDYLLQSYDSAIIENDVLLSELATLTVNNPTQLQKLVKVKAVYNSWINKFANPLRAIKPDTNNARNNSLPANYQQFLRDEENLNKIIQKEFRELLNVEYANRAKRSAILQKSEQQTKVISILLTGLSIVVGVVIALLLARHISKRILNMVAMANSIRYGNYKVQVEDEGDDELSELTRSLNHMAKTLEENISLLQRKNVELDQFAHVVSHDLKAPLRGIGNVISWIEEDHGYELPEKVSEYLQLIKGRINRSENLIQGLLTYARVGREEQVKEDVDLNLLITDVLESLPPVRTGLVVRVENLLPTIYTNRLPLLQIFTNLISNAVKYHDKPEGKISIYSKDHSSHYQFFVEDDGPGIGKGYYKKIFEIFQTLQERDSFESTGVGLAIIKKILDDRKEQININSEPGKGAVFSFTWTKF
ncbi:MAG: hypothetical protein JWQ96_455 [Segetibacter sp.]|nr:hypothetical protein [Segetibacter sp.]